MTALQIVEAGAHDEVAVMQVEREAFARDDEAWLVATLLQDASAQPRLSLLAWADGRPVGHVLFTRAWLRGGAAELPAMLLAPLAVLPAFQRRGVGRALIEEGARRLAGAGERLLFVLGDPAYYGRCGFEPAAPWGLRAPYPIVPEEAWQVRALAPGILGAAQGTVACATGLDQPEYWRE